MEQSTTLKVFLEKCQAIHGKNFLCLSSSNSLVPMALQLFGKKLCSGDETDASFEKILTSLPMECGTCPSWTVYGLRSTAELRSHLADSELLLKVVGTSSNSSSSENNNSNNNTSSSGTNGNEVIYCEEVFRFNDLYIVETSNRSIFPPNFLCFQFNGIRCTSHRLAQAFMRLSGQGLPPLQRFVLDLDDDARPSNRDTALTAPSKTYEMIQERLNKLQLFRSTRDTLGHSEAFQHSRCHLALRDMERVDLQDRLAERQQQIECHQQDLQQGGIQILDQTKLPTLIQATEQVAQNIRRLQQRVAEKQRQHVQLKFFIETRQQKLFKDILVVYPITQGKSGEYSIRGIELPYDLSFVKDDETLSSGLGYLVHVLLMLSKYWEIPLRYQLLFHGSRCLVRDLAANSTIYPLFRTYNDKERFDKGVFWLRIDLEQVLQTRGVAFDSSRSLLANLMQLSSCDVCHSLAY